MLKKIASYDINNKRKKTQNLNQKLEENYVKK